MTDLAALQHDQLAWNCADIDPESGVDSSPVYIGQDRAVSALRTGIELYAPGFNLFVSGLTGTERAHAVRELIEEIKIRGRTVSDRVFVHNFVEPRSPILLELTRGDGQPFCADVERVYATIMKIVPKALQAPSMAQRRRAIRSDYTKREQTLFQDLVVEAKSQGLGVVRIGNEEDSEDGLVEADIFPLFGDEPVPPEALDSLVREGKIDTAAAERLRASREALQTKLHEIRAQSQELSLEMAQRLEDLSKAICSTRVAPLIDGLRRRWPSAEFKSYFDQVESWLVDNVSAVLAYAHLAAKDDYDGATRPRELDLRLLTRAETRTGEAWDCPVVFQSNPSHVSLFGSILPPDHDGPRLAHIVQGAMLRADGGFVILRVLDLVQQPDLWNALKRVLKAGVIEIRPPESGLPLATSPLKPNPVPISTKVVLIGEEGAYETLCESDQEFKKIFKIHVQFETTMRRSDDNLELYAAAVRRIVQTESLLPAGPSGLARVAEFGARLAGSQRRLSTRFGEIADVYREASYVAMKKRASQVDRAHVLAAETQREARLSLPRDKYLERVEDGLYRFDVTGRQTGEINGLVVLNSAAWGYGRPTRISAQVGVGAEGIVNIERESELSGPIHEKGIQILSGYLLGTFARFVPLRLSATICFEQSYSGVDGDSASSTELYALLSALADVPLSQSVAVTGSVDQFGRIQAVGGVNEKIEGFFDVCRTLGLDAQQGCIIPYANKDDLMLRPVIVDAVREGKFRIWAIETIEQGLEILTGMEAGRPDGGEDCILGRVLERLRQFAEMWRTWSVSGHAGH